MSSFKHSSDDLESTKSLLFIDAELFEHGDLLLKKCYTVTPRRLSSTMHENVENMNNTLDIVQRSEKKIHGDVVGPPLLKTKQRLKASVKFCMRDGMCLSLG